MAVNIRNTSSMETAPAAPVKDDGRPYTYEMIYSSGTRRAYADDADELVDMLEPGYTSLTTAGERREARIRLALDAQVRLQAKLAADGPLGDCTDEERALILGSQHVTPTPATWNAPVPLVLVMSFYEPAGPLPRPQGPAERQIWLDPGDDWALLTSLHAAGVVQVAART